MIAIISNASAWSTRKLEESLLPTQGHVLVRVATYAGQVLQFGVFLTLTAVVRSISFVAVRLFGAPSVSPLIAFAKHPVWKQERLEKLPVPRIGFSNADYQMNGPKVHPETNWGVQYKSNPELMAQAEVVPDSWNHPERVILRLRDTGVNEYRFSISRDKWIEDKSKAAAYYTDFCKQLKENGIEPMVTFSHFCEPANFSWNNPADIDGWLQYVQDAASVLHAAGVRKFLTINEPGVIYLQGLRGEFSGFKPWWNGGLAQGAQMLEHMMRAHMRAYKLLKNAYPDIEVGIVHDPIRFRHYHKHNPLFSLSEQIVCHYLNHITHTALMRFYKTGELRVQIPFFVNHTFRVVDEDPSLKKFPIDFMGLQYYTDPLLKFGFFGGGSVTRNPRKEKLTSYGYRQYPQGMASILEEMRTLGVPIDITEVGIDTAVNQQDNDAERIAYFEKLLQAVQFAMQNEVNVRSLRFWTLIRNLEWSQGWKVDFGFYDFDPKTGVISPRKTVDWLRGLIERTKGANALDQKANA